MTKRSKPFSKFISFFARYASVSIKASHTFPGGLCAVTRNTKQTCSKAAHPGAEHYWSAGASRPFLLDETFARKQALTIVDSKFFRIKEC